MESNLFSGDLGLPQDNAEVLVLPVNYPPLSCFLSEEERCLAFGNASNVSIW